MSWTVWQAPPRSGENRPSSDVASDVAYSQRWRVGRSRNLALITEKVAALAEAQVATTATAFKGGKNTRIAKKALGVYARRILIATNVHAIAQACHPETSQTFWLGSMSIESAVGTQVLDGQSVDSGVIVDESPQRKQDNEPLGPVAERRVAFSLVRQQGTASCQLPTIIVQWQKNAFDGRDGRRQRINAKPISMWPGRGWKPRQAKIAALPLKRQPCGPSIRRD